MKRARVAALLAAAWVAAPAMACDLVLREARSGRELWRGALDRAVPELALHFRHSVLGSPVEDRYRWHQGRWLLTEERFEGQGYGLPHGAGPGERLERHGAGWRLQLQRVVDPLVVRPVRAMQLLRSGSEPLQLDLLSSQGIEFQASGC